MVPSLLKPVSASVKRGMCTWLLDLRSHFGSSSSSVVYSLWKFFSRVRVGVGESTGAATGVVASFFSADVVDVDKRGIASRSGAKIEARRRDMLVATAMETTTPLVANMTTLLLARLLISEHLTHRSFPR